MSVVVSGANVHDVKLLIPTLDSVVVEIPKEAQKHLCADAGYKGAAASQAIIDHDMIPHVRQRKEEASEKREKKNPPRRWVVERTHSWLNRYRKLLVSFEKTEDSYLGLTMMACALITWKKTCFIYG